MIVFSSLQRYRNAKIFVWQTFIVITIFTMHCDDCDCGAVPSLVGYTKELSFAFGVGARLGRGGKQLSWNRIVVSAEVSLKVVCSCSESKWTSHAAGWHNVKCRIMSLEVSRIRHSAAQRRRLLRWPNSRNGCQRIGAFVRENYSGTFTYYLGAHQSALLVGEHWLSVLTRALNWLLVHKFVAR